ncbi:MAG: hypothetical protein ACI9D0_001377 [Bacteroidia bacterium]|jgi:hypothetical protein
MSFEFLSPAAFGAGLLGLAAALFALHRLRVRHREVIVPTTIFWKQAMDESMARKLTASFRHPRAYAFVFAILGLLLLALAGPKLGANAGRDYVVLLDGSANMARGDHRERDLALTLEVLETLPRDRTQFVFAGATPTLILGQGESTLLFRDRTKDLQPEACPETITAELLRLARSTASTARQATTVYVIGNVQLPGALAMSLEERSGGQLQVARVHRTSVETEASASVNTTPDPGVVALGLAPAASGEWGAMDLWIESVGKDKPVVAGLDSARVLESSAAGIAASDSNLSNDAQTTGWWVRDLGLDELGDRIRVTAASAPNQAANANALRLDDQAELLAPNARGTIPVWLGPGVPSAFRDAVAADPGLTLSATPANAVAISQARAPGARATWLLQDAASLEASVVATGGKTSFASIFTSLGLAALESGDAEAAPVSFAAQSGDAPALSMDGALFAAPFELIEARAFPLLVGFSVRWLAGTETMLPFAAAGHELVAGDFGPGLTDASGRLFPAAGAGLVPPAAGDYDGLTASLLSRLTSGAGPAPDLIGANRTNALPELRLSDLKRAGGQNLSTWILFLALLLLLAEWHIYRTGRMP